MSGEKSQNVQDVFLNHIRKNKVPVTIFLINGVKLQGVVSSFDNFSLLLASRRPRPAGLQACGLHRDAIDGHPSIRAGSHRIRRGSVRTGRSPNRRLNV